MFQFSTAGNRTNRNLVGKNNNHFILSPNFLAQEIWQFGWVILLFHAALQRSTVGSTLQVDSSGGIDLVSCTHMVTWRSWGDGSVGTVSHSSHACPPQHGDLRVNRLFQWCLRIPRPGVSVSEAETTWPFMPWSQSQQ